MGFYVLVQPEEDAEAALVEHAQGHPSLVVTCGGSQITVQIPGRQDGAQFAIEFSRRLSAAATAFADRCEVLTRKWPALDFEALAATCGTTPEALPAEIENRHVLDVDEVWFSESGAGTAPPRDRQ